MNVMMRPSPDLPEIQGGAGGIATAIRAYGKLLREMGVTFVEHEEDADLIAIHAGAYYPHDPKKPVVALNHGLYWTGEYNAEPVEYEANAAVIAVLRRAQAIVVPSNWVAETIKRDMHITPFVIGHGVDSGEWEPLPPSDYVFWNKNRVTDVCSPQAVNELAVRFPRQKFLTTYAEPGATPNIKQVGTLPPAEMKPLVQQALVYLSTVEETFGIGTLEALACGVPVLGFAEAGNLDIVRHKVDGYLAIPRDYDDLAVGLEWCLDNRDSISKAARERALEFDWGTAVARLLNVFRGVAKDLPTITVVIPCYNYAKTLERTVKSVLKQTVKAEIIIVNNNSTDNTEAVAIGLAKKHKNVGVVNESRQGVAYARNAGIEAAKTKYICCLDADDVIEASFLEVCINGLEADPTLGMAYTGLRWVRADGETGISEWPGQFDMDAMLTGKNQVCTCSVFRREMWKRLGGYRQRYAPDGAGAEDAEFWLRGASIGYGAKKVTDAPLFVYSEGVGYVNGNPDYHEVNWRAWHPWVYDAIHPFASVATPDFKSHQVYQYDEPVVSVVIPCSVLHLYHLWDALDSLEAQDFRDWEAIVVVDSEIIPGVITRQLKDAYPFVRWFFTVNLLSGAGAARNLGADHARGGYLLFLDADDWLEPTALTELLTAGQQRAIVYSDYYGHAAMDVAEAQRLEARGRLVEYRSKNSMAVVKHFAADYDQVLAARQPELDATGNFYLWNLITSLVPKSWHKQIGGFDTTMASWEDWDYWLRFARAGAPFLRVAKPLVHYRFTTGKRREEGLKQAPALISYLEKKREDNDMCCGTPTPPVQYTPPPPMSINQGAPQNMAAADYQMIMLVDKNIAQHAIRGPVTKIDYGYRTHGDRFLMHVRDIEVMPSKEGHPRQMISLMVPAHNTIMPTVSNVQPDDEELDRTDVLPHTSQVEETAPPILIEGVPSIEMIPWITAGQRASLNKTGVMTVLDLIKVGADALGKFKGFGPKRVSETLAEAVRLVSLYE